MFIVRWPSGVTRIIERAVGAPTSAARRGELDAGRGQVVPIEFAELVGRDLADEARAAAERRDARRGVAGRSAADLMRRAHVRIEPLRFLGVDQPHRPLDQALRVEELVGRVGDHVDDGIADAQHVEAGVGHESPEWGKRAPSRAVQPSAQPCLGTRAPGIVRPCAAYPRLGPAPRRLRHRAAAAAPLRSRPRRAGDQRAAASSA